MEYNFITVYFVTREYGGPEEGGWWYDWYEMRESFDVRDTDEAVAKRLFDALDEYCEPEVPLSSVASRGSLIVFWEQQQGEFASTERPHYE